MKLVSAKHEAQVILAPVALMMCGHCRRFTGLLHGGTGPMLCCECVRAHRRWEALGGNGYCFKDEQHEGGKWCEEAIAPIRAWAENYATRSDVTVQWLAEKGREVRTCYCGRRDCEGLQMAHVREADSFDYEFDHHPEVFLPYPRWWGEPKNAAAAATGAQQQEA